MSEAQVEEMQEISQEADFDIEALQANIDNTLIDEPDESYVYETFSKHWNYLFLPKSESGFKNAQIPILAN